MANQDVVQLKGYPRVELERGEVKLELLEGS